jgi:rhodanese-related sulfurtransferase
MQSAMSQTAVLVLLALVAGFFLIRMLVFARPTISAEQARDAIASGTAVLIDVREPSEWREGVAASAVLLPLSDLRGPRQQWAAFLEQHRGKMMLLYCHSGSRSAMAASLLKAEGFSADNFGAYSRLVAAGFPTRNARGHD